MFLFKLFQKFLLPSIFLPLLIIIGLVLIWRERNKKIGKVVVLSGLVIYYLFSIALVADLILGSLTNEYVQVNELEINQAKIAVILSGGGESNMLRASEILRLYHLNPNLQIIATGISPLKSSQVNEVQIIKELLVERGVAEENIILEDKSRTTFESAQNVKNLIGQKPFFLVTSDYHMLRSILAFQKMGAKPIPAPTSDFEFKGSYTIFDFFPSPGNLGKVDLAFHEYFGIIYYKLKLQYGNTTF